MLTEFSRSELLLGQEAQERLYKSHVALFGVGGVGSFAAEAVARAGVGQITLIDNDTVSVTNRNRQLVALSSTMGRRKTDVMKERILDINPNANVNALSIFFTSETDLELSNYDFVIDAIDTVSSKLYLITECDRLGIPLICSMGTGNKLDPTRFEVADIYKTSVCPLARVIRLECRKRGIKHLKVVYSKEEPITPLTSSETKGVSGRSVPGSVSFVPPVAGMILASEAVKYLAGISK